MLEIKNGQDFSQLLLAYSRDKRDNALNMLPDGVDLVQTPPQLQVSPGQLTGPSQHTPAFRFNGDRSSNIFQGQWSFDASTCLLSMQELALVGPPGPVSLTLSGGTSCQGHPLQTGTIQVHLIEGEMVRDRLGVTHWPSGMLVLTAIMLFEGRNEHTTAPAPCVDQLMQIICADDLLQIAHACTSHWQGFLLQASNLQHLLCMCRSSFHAL